MPPPHLTYSSSNSIYCVPVLHATRFMPLAINVTMEYPRILVEQFKSDDSSENIFHAQMER